MEFPIHPDCPLIMPSIMPTKPWKHWDHLARDDCPMLRTCVALSKLQRTETTSPIIVVVLEELAMLVCASISNDNKIKMR